MYVYMEENNISQDKFFNIQKSYERYGRISNLEEVKNAGISISNITPNYEEVENSSFQENMKQSGK